MAQLHREKALAGPATGKTCRQTRQKTALFDTFPVQQPESK
jgi:hypothetical protein